MNSYKGATLRPFSFLFSYVLLCVFILDIKLVGLIS